MPFYFNLFNKIKLSGTKLGVYLALIIFNLSSFPAYNFYREFRINTAQDLRYTVGFRAWATELEISHISIVYFDEYGEQKTVARKDIYNKNNWSNPKWISSNSSAGLMESAIATCDGLKEKIILRNCGIAFKYDVFMQNKIEDFTVKAEINLIDIDSVYKDTVSNVVRKNDSRRAYYSAQICLKIPFDYDYYSDNYLGYEYFFEDFSGSKLRIPGLGYDFLTERLADNLNYPKRKTIRDYIANRFLKGKLKTNPNYPIKLSAFIKNNSCLFQVGYENETIPLFEFNLPADRAYLNF